MYGEGISKEGELIDIGTAVGVINKSGSWYSYNNEKIGQGKENTKHFLKEHPDIAEGIKNKILEIKEIALEKLDDISTSATDNE